jgi:small basic protein (TIGR04137 family)
MSIDKSLRIRAGATQQRNVLTRHERLEKLKAAERWAEGKSVLGLPKVRVPKTTLKKKKKAKKAEEEAAAAPAAGAPAAPAAPAKPAAKTPAKK